MFHPFEEQNPSSSSATATAEPTAIISKAGRFFIQERPAKPLDHSHHQTAAKSRLKRPCGV